ncbi:MAG TPA: hypothetical protein VFI96_07820 [Longimicrobiaceae bacterium]|nr:hypothetical protein [Longimicrobiaceae bacterium]
MVQRLDALVLSPDPSRGNHDEVRVPLKEFIWTPAIVVMDSVGVLDLKVSNDDRTPHTMLAPSMEGRRLVHLSDPRRHAVG